jgi:hypothetical protein
MFRKQRQRLSSIQSMLQLPQTDMLTTWETHMSSNVDPLSFRHCKECLWLLHQFSQGCPRPAWSIETGQWMDGRMLAVKEAIKAHISWSCLRSWSQANRFCRAWSSTDAFQPQTKTERRSQCWHWAFEFTKRSQPNHPFTSAHIASSRTSQQHAHNWTWWKRLYWIWHECWTESQSHARLRTRTAEQGLQRTKRYDLLTPFVIYSDIQI